MNAIPTGQFWQDISKNQLFIGLANGDIASVYAVNSECDEEYSSGDWQYPNIAHFLCDPPPLL